MSSIAITNAAEQLLQKAEEWGFIYLCQWPYYCYILPGSGRGDSWRLQLQNGNWLLSIDSIPQMLMSSIQALNFLARQYQKLKGTVIDEKLANYFLEIKSDRQTVLKKIKADNLSVAAASYYQNTAFSLLNA